VPRPCPGGDGVAGRRQGREQGEPGKRRNPPAPRSPDTCVTHKTGCSWAAPRGRGPRVRQRLRFRRPRSGGAHPARKRPARCATNDHSRPATAPRAPQDAQTGPPMRLPTPDFSILEYSRVGTRTRTPWPTRPSAIDSHSRHALPFARNPFGFLDTPARRGPRSTRSRRHRAHLTRPPGPPQPGWHPSSLDDQAGSRGIHDY
jgi:hypothetical protein